MQLPARLGTTQARLGAPATIPIAEIGPTPTTITLSFPSPRMCTVTEIGPTHFALSLTFPSPRVSTITPIGPTPTHFPLTFPSPRVAPRVSGNITPTALRLPLIFPTPAMVGADRDIHVWLGGVEITKYLAQKSCKLTSATQGRWTAEIVCWDRTGAGIGIALPTDPTKGTGQSVMIVEGGQRRFMGCLNQWKAKRQMSNDAVQYTLGCIDKSGICDHRIVPLATYPAGMDIADVVRDICARCLNGEGITLEGVPVSLGPLDNSEKFDFCTVTQAFDTLALDAGAAWWVNVFGQLNFILLTNLPAAPFGLTETSRNWQNIDLSASLTNYRNRQYVKSNLSVNPGGVPSTIETYTLPQDKAVALGFRLGTIVLDFSASQIIRLKVNGVAQAGDGPAGAPGVRNGYGIGINLDKSWWAILPTPYVYAPDSTLPTPTPPLGFPYPAVTSAFPAPGDVIEIEYIPASTNASVEEADSLIPSLPGLSKCGSGIYEAVEQVKNISSAHHLSSIANLILTRSGSVPMTLVFDTFKPGLEVGQVLPASIPRSQIPMGSTFVITNITAIHQGNAVDKHGARGLGFGSGYIWTVTAISGIEQLNAIGMFEKLIARTENPLPIPIFEYDQIALEPGGSIAGGIVSTNPAIAQQTGKMIQVTVQFTVAPTDQTLTLDIKVNGSSVLGLANLIHIPSGDTSQHIVTAFSRDPAPFYVFANDTFTVEASYVVTGSNPARAGSGTIIIKRQV